ncbi:multidrug/spermidine efflux SMR transporter subunit MdtJ [Zophobihabitans entericus]|uniref:Spermidine export protein MdtJ n=1 Tax=Zophobihabitans entericus TaxID=1635327 RepID=A0A6G9IBF4_9GAMM|nr:multidrug/spermidine efflux SMR transporter subunit MdtJ [Zophobihabitans entericus]QIQ21565.1 multidrug/spermidine efflux SMR transporter subunit MdtJ [Zophobihabitans entericus]
MIYWIFLLFAIVAEIIGTVSMKYASVHGAMTGHVVMFVMIACSYLLLAIAVKKIALGVAYALWEGIGTVAITFFSVAWFGEVMTPLKATGLAVLLLGIALVKSGCKEERARPAKSRSNVIKLEVNHATA